MDNDYEYVVSERVMGKLLEQYATGSQYCKMRETVDFYREYTSWFKDYVIADNHVADLLIDQHVEQLMDNLGQFYINQGLNIED